MTSPSNSESEASCAFHLEIAAFGAIVCATLVITNLFHVTSLSTIDVLFLIAVWVAVPLGINLLRIACTPLWDPSLRGRNEWILMVASSLVTLSFLLPEGRFAALLCGGWMFVTFIYGLDGTARLLRFRFTSFSEFSFGIAQGYLLVGALWLFASRLGIQPVGFREPLVLLTAVHFHYAGFASAVLVGVTACLTRDMRGYTSLRVGMLGAVCGPGLLGIAFLLGPKVKLIGVAMIVIGQLSLAFSMLRIGQKHWNTVAGPLLMTASGCIVVGIILAALWALGEYPLHPIVDLAQMAKYHGMLNSVGFALSALLGLTSVLGSSAPRLSAAMYPRI